MEKRKRHTVYKKRQVHLCFDANIRGLLMQTYHAEMGRTMDLLFLDEDLSVGRLNPLTPSFRKRMLEERGIPTEDSFCGEYRTFLRRIEGLSPEDSCYVWCSKDPYELTGFALASTYLASIMGTGSLLRQWSAARR